MAGVITFRPTPEAQEVLDRIKEEGANVSKYINALLQGKTEGGNEYTQIVSCYPEHQYPGTSVVQNTVPISRLSARKYREFIDVLHSQQMKYYYFKVSEQHTFGIIATCHEEASIEFARYYAYDKRDDTYNRTAVPLPQIRYDAANRVAVVITTELLTIKQ